MANLLELSAGNPAASFENSLSAVAGPTVQSVPELFQFGLGLATRAEFYAHSIQHPYQRPEQYSEKESMQHGQEGPSNP